VGFNKRRRIPIPTDRPLASQVGFRWIDLFSAEADDQDAKIWPIKSLYIPGIRAPKLYNHNKQG
jgi:hypothetical protein